MFIDDTALSAGLAASTSRSTVSCSSEIRMSQRFTASISLSFGSTRLESGLTSTSATARKPLQRAFGDRLGDEDARPRHCRLAAFLMAALTLGSTFSASRVIERLASFGSRQSLPA